MVVAAIMILSFIVNLSVAGAEERRSYYMAYTIDIDSREKVSAILALEKSACRGEFHWQVEAVYNHHLLVVVECALAAIQDIDYSGERTCVKKLKK